ncbi:DENN (AEX-3) domain-containing protein [Phthorimaea operculella]|nr:DENN (AEX-3) domain-containing protein [Phthorimaea operculella]
MVPPPGGPQVRFSIGAGDRQALQPPASPPLPTTHTAIYMLLRLLGTISTNQTRNNLRYSCALLVGVLVGCVMVPPPGGPQVRFSIGAGDRQALQPPASPPLPTTHTAIYMLLRLLGTISTNQTRNNLRYSCALLVGVLVGCVMVPPPGGPQVRFSIGAGDRQALQPPASPPLPTTHTAIYMLLRLLGTISTNQTRNNLRYSCALLVGVLVGCVMVPPPGGPQVRFSIGAGDRQALQPPASPPLPTTHTAIYMLLRLLVTKLGTISTNQTRNNLRYSCALLVGVLVGCVMVPPPGGPQVRFSIGAGDRQALQPPASPPLPTTHTAIYMLLRLLVVGVLVGCVMVPPPGGPQVRFSIGAGDRQALQPPASPPLPTTHTAIYMLLRLLVTKLGTISTNQTRNNLRYSCALLVGVLVGCVMVPPPGGPQVRFSIGAGDRQALQPPASPPPTTHTAIYMLLRLLGTISSNQTRNNLRYSCALLVGVLVGCVMVPPPGGPQVRFSIGAGDRQALQPPASPPLPTTHTAIYMLLRLLGTISSNQTRNNLRYSCALLVGVLVGCVMVPPPGGPQVRFSIGAGDRQALQPPASPPLPTTHTAIYMLLRLLGTISTDQTGNNLRYSCSLLVGVLVGCVMVPPPGGPQVRFSIGAGDRQALQPPASPPLPTTHCYLYALEAVRNNLRYSCALLVGVLVGCVMVPPPGGPQVRFSIGAGDRQALQPPASPPLPTTHTAIYMLLRLLGTISSNQTRNNLRYSCALLVGVLVGCVMVPPPGGPQVRFSIGAGDRQALQPPASPPLPTTQTSIYMLLRLLGTISTNQTRNNLRYSCALLVGVLVGCVMVPPPGGPQVRFSIGAGDRQALQPPASPPLPTTHTAIYMLLRLLGTISTNQTRNNLRYSCALLVGVLVGCVMVPPPGGPQVRFSIGAGDRQALQPPASPPLPTTHTAIYMLLRLLGIHNSVTLWCAVMSEHKVLVVSLAGARLAAACRALAALMFPFRYAHVYIPLLPAGLAEVLATPTPFLIGVHSSLKEEVSELLDVIVADLDVGSLHIPPGVNIPSPEGKLLSSLQEALALVLQPELRAADAAFAPPPPLSSPPHMLDKEIRAVFMRTLARLLQGYRHCLTIIRIHPTPVLTFHKAGFLGSRGLSQCQFAQRLLDSMFFNGLVAERGPPWRATDIWDELVQNLPEQLRLEALNPDLQLQHIQDLAMQLHLNENPNPQAYQQRILRPPEGASQRIHQPPFPPLDAGKVREPPFPPLDAGKVREVIEEVTARNANNPKLSALRPPQPRIVSPGAPPTGATELSQQLLVTNSARRLEVLRACIAAIFDTTSSTCSPGNGTSGSRALPRPRRQTAQQQAPTAAPPVRPAHQVMGQVVPALCRDLAARLPSNKHLLQHHQFDLLTSTTSSTCSPGNGTSGSRALPRPRRQTAQQQAPTAAPPVRPAHQVMGQVVPALCRDLAARLPSNKHLLQHHQFDLLTRLMNCALQSATALDEHSIAAAMLPLATAYCRKLCTGVIQYAYMCIQEHQVWTSQQFWEAAFYQDVQRDIKALYLPTPNQQTRVSPRHDEEYVSLLEPSALEIAAEQMRAWPSLPPEKQRELIASEESTLYSQAIHYANRMVYLLLPLEGAGKRAEARGGDTDRASNSITNSVAESDSADAESGFEEADPGEAGNNVIKMVSRVDAESDFEEADPGEAGNNVIKMVSRFVDKVCTEGGVTAEHVRCLHQMIPGVVHMHLESLDAVARESRRLPPVQKPRIVAPSLVAGEAVSAPALRAYLVADGRQTPLLPAEGALFLTNYRVVFKGAPTDPFACEQTVVRSFPLCSLTREKAVRTHYLPHLEQSLQEGLQLRSATFQLIKVALDEEVSSEQAEAFRKQLARLRHPEHPLLHFALAPRPAPPPPPSQAKHHTLRGFAKKTLLKTARRAGLKPKPSKRQKYVLPSADARSLTSPPLMSSLSADTLSLEELELAGTEPTDPPAARTLERVRERIYARDWARLGLANQPFRLAHANAVYTLCRSYPAVIPVPESIGDESLRRIARCYRQNRLPVVTWKHPRTHALLARSSVSHHKGVMGMLKSSHQNPNTNQGAETTSSLEQERYLATLVACTPASRGELEDSSLSLDSLLLCCDDQHTHTPLLTKAAGTLRYLSTLVACTPASRGELEDSSLSLDSLLLCCDDQHTHTPLLTKAAGTLRRTARFSRDAQVNRVNIRKKKNDTCALFNETIGCNPQTSERHLSTLVACTPASRGELEDSSLSLDSLLLCCDDQHTHTPLLTKAAGTLRYLSTLVACTPASRGELEDSSLSLDSLLLCCDDQHTHTPLLTKAAGTLRYLSTLVACTPASRGELEDSSLSLDSLLLCCDDQHTHTPLLTKAAGTLSVLGRNSGGKGGVPAAGARHFGRWGSLKGRQPSHLDLYAPRQRLSTADQESVSGDGGGSVRRASLYILTEKGAGGGGVSGVEVVPVEYPDTRATKHAFKKLMRAAVPSAPPQQEEPGFLRMIEESGWLWQLRQLFQLSGAVVDLLDLQGSSVLLALEEGWDCTAQISSLAQICLEPYYRTLEGFRIIVEKEWLALGHKFATRSNISPEPQQGYTPTFLMLLDAVHQLQKQFPLAFEFNEYYLRFIAYHTVSCRFRTFLLDSEAQRAELGIAAADDKRADTSRLGVETGAGSEEECGGYGSSLPRHPAYGHSLFDYIDRHHQKSPIFYNFLYTPDLDNPVLRPVSSVCALEVWDYYVSEELSHGAPYDLEVLASNAELDKPPARRVATAGYDSIPRTMPDAFTGLLERIRQLELELGHLPQKWRVRWEQLELPYTLELQRVSSMSSGVVRRATLATHKRSTLEVCDHCADLLWGPLKTGVRCVDCGAACHERCAEAFALPCTKYKAPPPQRERDHLNTVTNIQPLASASTVLYTSPARRRSLCPAPNTKHRRLNVNEIILIPSLTVNSSVYLLFKLDKADDKSNMDGYEVKSFNL